MAILVINHECIQKHVEEIVVLKEVSQIEETRQVITRSVDQMIMAEQQYQIVVDDTKKH